MVKRRGTSKSSRGEEFPSGAQREQLLERAAKLKGALVEFVLDRHAHEILEPSLLPGVFLEDEETPMRIEEFLADFRYDDGESLHDRFVKTHKGLSREDRKIVLGWEDSVLGLFRIDGISDDDILQAFNEVDELEYRVISHMGGEWMRELAECGSWFMGRVARLRDVWIISGVVLPYDDETDALAAAAELRMSDPRLAFRNPQIVEQARELQRGERDAFVEDFGARLVVGPPEEVLSRWNAHIRRRIDVMRENAERESVDVGESATPSLDTMPEIVRHAQSLGLLYDERHGMMMATGVQDVLDYLDGDATTEEGADILEDWLDDDSLGPAWFREFARHDVDRLNEALRVATKNPHFDWERDGEELLRRRKDFWFDESLYPSTTPVSVRLAQARARKAKRERKSP